MIKRIGMKIAQKASDDTGLSGHMEHMKVRYSSSGSLSKRANVSGAYARLLLGCGLAVHAFWICRG